MPLGSDLRELSYPVRRLGVVQEVAGSLVERALAGVLLERPVRSPRLPVAMLSREQKATELQRLQARKAMDAAYEAELILGLADDSPGDDDPAPGTPGARSWKPDPELPGVSEFLPAELAMILNCGRLAAGRTGPGPTGPTCPRPGRRWPPGCWTSTGPGRW